MLGVFRAYREKGWSPIDRKVYADIWLRAGGSVMTHPDIVAELSELAGIETRYLAWFQQNVAVAGIATWGRHLALSRRALKRYGKRDVFDLGNAEVILPVLPAVKLPMRFSTRYVSELNAEAIPTLKRQKESIALAKPPNEYSKKFLYNQKRELRLFSEQGGIVHPILELAPAEIAETYSRLFTLRWGFSVPGGKKLTEVFTVMRPFMTGSVLHMHGNAVAIQILYRVESPEWISTEYINGGVDPGFQKFSPGSILTFLNTQAEWEYAQSVQKSLRFSFGRVDREYKMLWCRPAAVFRTWP